MAKKGHASYLRFEPLITDWGTPEAPYHGPSAPPFAGRPN